MIELSGVRIVYPAHDVVSPVVAIEDLNLVVQPQQFVCLLGPSGCGKTTLLKAIMGLVPLSAGDVRIGGVSVTGPGPDRAMVFQNFALLPWADVLTNVAFGLELRGVAKQ